MSSGRSIGDAPPWRLASASRVTPTLRLRDQPARSAPTGHTVTEGVDLRRDPRNRRRIAQAIRGSRVASSEKSDEQSSKHPALTGRQAPQDVGVDRHGLRDELIAQGPPAVGEMDPTDASVGGIGDTGDESTADHAIDRADYGRWLDRDHSRQVGLAHAIPPPQEQVAGPGRGGPPLPRFAADLAPDDQRP